MLQQSTVYSRPSRREWGGYIVGGVGGLWWGTQGGTTDPPHYGEVGPRPRGLRHGCALLPGETREPFAPLRFHQYQQYLATTIACKMIILLIVAHLHLLNADDIILGRTVADITNFKLGHLSLFLL